MKSKDRDNLIAVLREHALSTCSETLKPVTTETACNAASEALGFKLPEFLVRCYTEIGNGGFGPAYGLIGIDPDGHTSSFGDLVTTYRIFTEPDPEEISKGPDDDWREKVLPFCDWGCLIFSCVSCRFRDYPVVTVDNGVVYPMHFTIENYFARWMHGRRVR